MQQAGDFRKVSVRGGRGWEIFGLHGGWSFLGRIQNVGLGGEGFNLVRM